MKGIVLALGVGLASLGFTGVASAAGHGGGHGGGGHGGGQAGAQYVAGRLNQLHGQHGHSRAQAQPEADGNAATASKISNFFMILGLLRKQRGDYCFGRVV